ncbi:P.93 [Pragia fontium]|uniref:autotransporter outer membrane beta-barrel domain-containing protein n=1 Tax=Pragia fontium TaxID=82985 RepID=UPI000DFAADA5|nr:autotransporter outer membrane beta-barrel domain-containing protein [Pragia fontium]SUB82708.1 P.93 [Pragia fontium]
MDMLIYQKEFSGKLTGRFSKHKLNQQLAMAGLLSLSAFIFQHPAWAADLGSQNANTIELNDGDKIIADLRNNGHLYGVFNQYATANINLANDVSIIVNDPASIANGIIIAGDNSVLTANRLSLEVDGTYPTGLDISGKNASVDLGSDSKIMINGSGSMNGIYIHSSGSTLQAERLLVMMTTTGDKTNNSGAGIRSDADDTLINLGQGSAIYTTGNESYGIRISGSSKFEATELTIDTKGEFSHGVQVGNSSIVNLGTDSKITTSGTESHGVWNFGDFKADGLTIKTTGANSAAIDTRNNGVTNIGAGSHLSATQAGALVAYNTDSGTATVNFSGTAAQRNTISSGGSYGASAQFNSIVNLSNTDIYIDRAGALGRGLWALGGGKITGDNLMIKGAAATRGVYAQTNSQIDLTGDTTIYMANPADMAIATQYNEGYATSRINAMGKLNIQGGILSHGGLINLDMQPGSLWSGRAFSDNVNGGELNITMTDSRWNMTADSNLDKLVLNHSTVDFSEDKTGSLLTVGDLSGYGRFILRTDLVGDGIASTGDKLVVTGKSAGDHQLTVLNHGSLATTGHEVLTVVETQDGQATFTSTGKVELGGYLYNVRKNGTNWELYSSGIDVPLPDPKPEPKPQPDPDPSISTSADAGANFLNIGYLMNYAETQTLLQRMGDLRQNGKNGDMWLRGFAGKFDSFAGGKLSHFDMNYSGIQLGADKRVSTELPLFAGIFMGQTHGKPNYRSGDGTTKSDSAGLYATYMANNGFYLDGVAKYSHIKNSFNVKDSQNNRVNGNGNSDGFSASLESGQKFSLNQPGNGFYIEPQAQFSYSHQGTSNVVASNGLKVDLGSYESMIGRVSAVVGYELQQGDNSLNVYLKTGYLREFSGDTDYRLNGSPESHSFKGDWWNNGVGVSAQMNQQHTLYLDLDTSTGDKFNQSQINAGYRFSF